MIITYRSSQIEHNPVPYNYRLWNGKTMSKSAVDRYNYLEKEIAFYELHRSNLDLVELMKDEKHRIVSGNY